MTTIAWDGKTLAADSRSTAGNLYFRGVKIWRLDDGRLFAASGDAQDGVIVRDWLNAGGLGGGVEKPTVSDNFSSLLVANGSLYRLEEKLVPFIVLTPYHAVGSGRDFAIAAMALGKSARDAVAFAARFDVATDDNVVGFDA